MAVIRIQAQKDARCMQAVYQIHGDRRTQILRFDVNRFDGGVDLGGLRWVIKTTNALGKEDIFDPEAVEIKERTIAVDWLVDGSVTDATGIASYELNGIDTTDEGQPVQWSGGLGSISVRAGKGPKFGEMDGMTNIEKLILYVEEELDGVIEAGSAALDAAARANQAADAVENLPEAVESANTAAQRAMSAAAAVEDLEGAVNRANAAATMANINSQNADMAASSANDAANRATEAAKNVENIEEATLAAHEAAEAAHAAADVANTAGLPAAMIYGMRVKGETVKASGNPVAFLPDAGSLLQPVTVLEPQQEGSGDPYPAGGGRNKLDFSGIAGTQDGLTFSVNADGSVTINGTATASNSRIGGTCVLPDSDCTFSMRSNGGFSGTGTVFSLGTNIDVNLANSEYSVLISGSGTIQVGIWWDTGVVFNNFRIYLMIEEGSVSTPYMPYSNIRPITGYDALGLNHVGKNLTSALNVYAGAPSYAEILEDGRNCVRFKSNNDAKNVPFPFEENTRYAVSFEAKTVEIYSDATPAECAFCFWYTDGTTNFISVPHVTDWTNFKMISAAGKTVAAVGVTSVNYRSYIYVDIDTFQMEKGESVTPFEPYQSTPYTVQLGQTVYGLRYEWLTGKGWIEWAMRTLDGTEDVAMGEQGGARRFCIYSVLPGILKADGANTNMVCSHYRVDANPVTSNAVNCRACGFADDPNLYVRDDAHESADAYKAFTAAQYAAGTPVQVVYELAEPIEIDPFPPHIISAVDPEQTNTLYGDGSVEVEYVKPLHVSIEERVAAIAASILNQ